MYVTFTMLVKLHTNIDCFKHSQTQADTGFQTHGI